MKYGSGAIAASWLVACAGSESPSPDYDAQAVSLNAPSKEAGRQLLLEVNVPAGEELFKCLFVQPSTTSYDVTGWESSYSEGSHHLLLFSTGYTELPRSDVFDCGNIGDLGIRGIAYGAQTRTSSVTYPQGVAMHFDAEDKTTNGTVLLYQTHYLNTTLESIHAEVRTNVYFADPATVEQVASTVFFYNYNIAIPATVGSSATASMRCPISEDIHLLGLSSHMHRRGVDFMAHLVGSDEVLFETTDWEAPEPRLFEPALTVAAGSSFEFTCQYENDRESATVEGPSADTNEMCVLFGGYYPKLSFDEEFCLTGGPVFNGSASCSQTMACYEQCAGDDVCEHECTAQVCAGSGEVFQAFIRCGILNGCLDSDDDSCFAACIDEYNTCAATTDC